MEAIRVERREGLVTITLDRPEKKNALDGSDLDRARPRASPRSPRIRTIAR